MRFLAGVALCLALPAAAADRLPTVDLSPNGGRETWPIDRGQVRRHEIALLPGEFLQATVVQARANVVVRTVTPLGVSREVDLSEGGRGREPASILATTPGTYAIEVEVASDGRAPGAYVLQWVAPHPSTPRDHERLRAESALGQAAPFIGPRSGDTRMGMPGPHEVDTAYRWLTLAEPVFAAEGDVCWTADIRTDLLLLRSWNHTLLDTEEYSALLELWAACGDEAKFAETLLYAGKWYQRSARFDEAASTLDFGLRLVDEQGDDPFLRAQFLVALGTVRAMRGETLEAIRLEEAALPTLRQLHHVQGEAVILSTLATAYHRRGALQQARDLALEAVRLNLSIDYQIHAQLALLTAAHVEEDLGDAEEALRHYEQAAGLVVTDPKVDLYSVVIRAAAAGVLGQLGRRQEAERRLRALIDVAASHPEVLDIQGPALSARLTLASLYADESAWAEALPQIEAGLAAEQRSGDPYVKSGLLELRGRVHLGQGDPQAARDDHEAALALRRALGDRIGEAASLYELSRVARALGDEPAALARLQDARAVVSQQRALIVSPRLRATWATTVRRIDEAYVDLKSAAAAHGDAFDASEAAHARALLDLLGESHAALGEGADPALVARERELRAELTEQMDRSLRAPAGPEAAAVARVRDLEAQYERVRAELRASHPRYADFADPQPLRLAEVQRDLLDGDTALVEYFLGPGRSHAWVVTRDRMGAFDLAPRAEIDRAVAAMRRAVERRPGAPSPSAPLRALARLVLDPLAPALGGRRLVVVPDGSLHYVPFAALTDAQGRPLLTRFEIVNAPSASVVALQRRSARPPAERAVAVLADPVFDRSDERVSASARSSDPVPKESAERLARFGFRGGRLPRLPFTRTEAREILASAPAAQSRLALDFGASLSAVRDPDIASYRYLHFATHGLLDDARPELSGLVLTLVDEQGREQTGLLTSPEVLDLRLRADLVVLSSCRSALGREVKGEGLLGLTRAFMYAGAPRVVASLWPVADRATAELMKRFYAAMLGPDALAPAAALRRAQQELRRHPEWRAPYFWAGFELQGEWR